MKSEVSRMSRSLDDYLWVACWTAMGLLVGSVFMGLLHLFLTDSRAESPERLRLLHRDEVRDEVDRARRTGDRSTPLAPIESLDLLEEESGTPSARSGDTVTPDVFREGAVEKIEETDLNFELVGTVDGAQRYRYAVVRNLEDRKVRHLRPGQTWGDMEVRRVRSRGVTIRNRRTGRREHLPLRRTAESVLGGGSEQSTSNRAKKVSRYQINQAIHNNMNNLLASVKVQPVLGAGGIRGFRIEELRGRPGRLLERLGFQENDVVKRVNGKKIDSMDQALKLWSQLSNRKDFRVRIERNGKTRTLEYSMVR